MYSDLKIHFLNVGHGDCTVIRHPSGRLSVIDTSNGEKVDNRTVEAKLGGDVMKRALYNVYRALGSSARRALKEAAGVDLELTNPVDFLNREYPNQQVFRYIQTHPEMDHMRGLAALDSKIVNFWDTGNDRDCEPRESDKQDWKAYRRFRSEDRRKVYVRGSRCAYFGCHADGTGEGDRIAILSPSTALTRECDESEDWNNMSLVLKVTHAGTSIILGGDAGDIAWQNMLANVRPQLTCTVLKAAHHGRLSGYNADALRQMGPLVAILSIGEDCEHEAYEEYKKHCKHVWSTYECGNITLTINAQGGIVYNFANPLAVA